MSEPVRAPFLQNLFQKGRTQHFQAGQSIGSTDQSDLVLFVTEGYVKRYMIRSDGNLGVQIVYGQQDIFSLTHIYEFLLDQSIYDGPETYYYTALSDVTVLAISPKVLMQAVEDNPLLYRELFSEAGRHLRACVHNIENISLHSINARVAHHLNFLFEEFGRPNNAGVELGVPLTHQDLADLLGVTRASVTLAIGKLREKGLILPSRQLVTPDIAMLAREAHA